MNLRNINNLLILFIIFLLFSCSKIKSVNNDFKVNNKNEIEKIDIIEETKNKKRDNFFDYYSRNNYSIWNNSKEFKKLFHITTNNKIYANNSNISNLIIFDNRIFFVDSKINFVQLDIVNGKKNIRDKFIRKN